MNAAVLPRYLTGQFLKRIFSVTLALSGILLVFDLLSNIVAVTNHHHHLLQIIGYYIELRYPSILTLALPLGVLLSAMILLSRLALSLELTAMFASGVTIYYIVIIMSLAALAPAGVHFLLSNTIVPDTASRLDAWAKNDYNGSPPATGRTIMPAWFAADNDMVQAQGASRNGRTLKKVIIIRRDATGLITDYYNAEKAKYDGQQWQLDDAEQLSVSDTTHNRRDHIPLNLTLKPDSLSAIGEGVTEVSLPTMWHETHDHKAELSNPLYKLWIQRKLAEPFESLIMVFLAAPLAFQLSRRHTVLSSSFAVIAAGFAYFIAERLMLSFGETGTLNPYVAVWTPSLMFGMISWWFILYKQE